MGSTVKRWRDAESGHQFRRLFPVDNDPIPIFGKHTLSCVWLFQQDFQFRIHVGFFYSLLRLVEWNITLYLPLFLNDAVPEEHKSGIDMSRDLLRHSHVLVVYGHTMTEAMKNDIAVAQWLGITATTLEGILTVKGQGRR